MTTDFRWGTSLEESNHRGIRGNTELTEKGGRERIKIKGKRYKEGERKGEEIQRSEVREADVRQI